ncbi:MAG: hypothetical protein CMJ55_00700 [Planctomycetaceae bacterium]|jgi:hypothetical protein|nr:hypothetical protein [Planctomycetaceae bacterium]MDB4862758.1 hypothetical protein [Pirellulaceae bacterium]
MSEECRDKRFFVLSKKRIMIWAFGLLLLTSLGKLVAYEILGANQLRNRIGRRVVFPSDLLKNSPRELAERYGYLKSMKYRMNARLGFFDLELHCEIPQQADRPAGEIMVGLSPRETLDLLIVTNKTAGLPPEQFLSENEIPLP